MTVVQPKTFYRRSSTPTVRRPRAGVYVPIRDGEEFGFMVRVRAGRFRTYQQSEYLEVASDCPFGFATFGHFKWIVRFNLHLRIYRRAGVFLMLPPT